MLITPWTNLATPHRQWVVLPDTDHAAHLEKPRASVDAIDTFARSTTKN